MTYQNNNYQAQPAPQGQAQQGGQYEKNPNGGYLNKSNYGADSWYGKLVITPELMAQAQQTGALLVEVKDVQTTQYGPCRRVVAKPYTPKPVTHVGAEGAAQPAQPYNTQPAPVMAPQPTQVQVQQGGYAPAPVQQGNNMDDAIPF